MNGTVGLIAIVAVAGFAAWHIANASGSAPAIQIKPEHCMPIPDQPRMFCGVIIESEFQVKEVER